MKNVCTKVEMLENLKMVHKTLNRSRLSSATWKNNPNLHQTFVVYLHNNAKPKGYFQKYVKKNQFPFI